MPAGVQNERLKHLPCFCCRVALVLALLSLLLLSPTPYACVYVRVYVSEWVVVYMGPGWLCD